MTSASCARRLCYVLIASFVFPAGPALAASAPASPLTPGLLFSLAVVGPMLVPAAAYTAGFIADLLQRSKKD